MTEAATVDVPSAFEGFSGMLIGPADPGYDEARRLHNAMIDRRPGLIARCQGVADVVASLAHARKNGLEISIRGGGHNVGGTALTEGGLTIDLSGMKGIYVDPVRRRVWAEGGVLWRELNRETQLYGLAVTGGVISTTGIAGLTLGGGLGWLMSKHGLAADNLVSADVVTADGRLLTASAEENDDLFWALRGGGGNFGVVTSFEYELHPIGPVITGGLVVHPFPAAGEVLRFFRDYTSSGLSDDLTTVGALVHAPDGSGMKAAGIAVCHVGSAEDAQGDLEPLLAFGSPVDVQVGPMPYEAVCSMLDEAFAPGFQNYWKSTFLDSLSDEAIDTAIERFAETPSAMSGMVLEHFHGAVARIPVEATACPHRREGYNFLVTGVWPDPADSAANVAWTQGTYDAMTSFGTGRRWLNYIGAEDGGANRAREAFGPNYDRLAAAKKTYDPENVFHLNVNISPAPG